jgi:hypothetical protein
VARKSYTQPTRRAHHEFRRNAVAASNRLEFIMRFALFCAAAALAAAPALAEEVIASSGTDSVRLSDKPCTSQQVLALLEPSLRPALRDASAVVQGQLFKACWVVHGDAAHLLYEDGDQGLIPLADFKIPKSA